MHVSGRDVVHGESKVRMLVSGWDVGGGCWRVEETRRDMHNGEEEQSTALLC